MVVVPYLEQILHWIEEHIIASHIKSVVRMCNAFSRIPIPG